MNDSQSGVSNTMGIAGSPDVRGFGWLLLAIEMDVG